MLELAGKAFPEIFENLRNLVSSNNMRYIRELRV